MKGFGRIRIAGLLIALAAGIFFPQKAEAARKEQTIYANNPYVSMSPDGKAFTLGLGKKGTAGLNDEQYRGIQIRIHGKMKKEPAPKGSHYYVGLVEGKVPVEYWELVHPRTFCIHGGDHTWFGLDRIGANSRFCGEPYLPGWLPYCAYCGKQIGNGMFFLDPAMARSLPDLQSGSEYSNYFYLCPHNRNLEQTIVTDHYCQVLSDNRYRVQYHANAKDAEGYMETDLFYFNNGNRYEGKAVTPQTFLSANRFQRKGYVFAGWSTAPAGSVAFQDRQDWLKVQRDVRLEERGNDFLLDLYAVWKPVGSGLLVKPEGGTFRGRTGDALFQEGYGTTMTLDRVLYSDLLVTLDGNGASEFSSKVLKSPRTFVEWKKGNPFLGAFDSKKGTYTFSSARAGSRDTLTAAWTAEAVILPAVTRAGYAFEGWYEVRNGRSFYVGGAKDRYVPRENVTLRAGWTEVALKLDSIPVYDAGVNRGKGAADLSWGLVQDRSDVSYKLYRGKEGESRAVIHSAGEFTGEVELRKTFADPGETMTLTVPSTGQYEVTLTGASGGSHGQMAGGKGGKVKLTLWLTEGQILKMETGKPGQDGDDQSPATGGGASRLYLKNGAEPFRLLAVAGGGGGANESYPGGAGGASEALREKGAEGESRQLPDTRQETTSLSRIYASGGGDGYVGGLAGRVTYRGHVHSAEICGYHEHVGTVEEGGICYGKEIRTAHVHDDTCPKEKVAYCGAAIETDQHGNRVRGYCPNCGRNEKDGCTSPDGKCVKYDRYTCNSYDRITYEMDCDQTEGWQCGKTEDNMELMTGLSETWASGGGCNYVTDTLPGGCYILYQQYDSPSDFGVAEGTGRVMLSSRTTGYRTDRVLKGVTATDEAAPGDIPGMQIKGAGTGRLSLSWEEPADFGTEYRFLAECYDIRSGRLLATSNETKHNMATGIAGYYIRTDSSPSTDVGSGNGKLQTGRTMQVTAREDRRIYVHIAAVDRAGNIGPSTHVAVDPREEELLWDVETKQLILKEGKNIWNAGKGDYYIRADGLSPVQVTLEGELKGPARSSYQIRSLKLQEVESGAGYETVLPYVDPAGKDRSFGGSEVELAATGKTVLKRGESFSAERFGSARNVRMKADFLPGKMAEGQRIHLYPEAVAQELTTGESNGSDHAVDLTHGVCLIADVTPPSISGIQQARTLGSTIDRSKTPSAPVTFTASDSGSGVEMSEFYVTITNRDNLVTRRMEAVNGKIRVELATAGDYLFSGDLELTVHAADRVGNVSEETISFSEFDLETSVSRILEPVDGLSTFKRGESGILHITATGYADSVEVTFPQGLTAVAPELNHVFDYSSAPDFQKKEDYVFMIPLYPLMQEKDSFEISVTARKGDLTLTSHPRIHVLELDGSVLDELVTSLR